MDQSLGKLSIYLKFFGSIRVGEIIAQNSASNTHVIKLGGLRAQARFDVPQTRPISELSERHASILIKASECIDVSIAIIPRDTLLENRSWQMLYDIQRFPIDFFIVYYHEVILIL